MKTLLRTGALGAALVLAAVPARAQTVNTMLGVGNAYVWRGITLADQTFLQGELSLGLPVMGGTLTGGVWAANELDPSADRFSSLTGFQPGIGEADLYAQYAHAVGAATLTGGVTALRFPEIPEWDTFEVFGSASLPNAPLAPTLTVRKDVDAVGGFYAEGGVSQALPLAGRPVTLAGTVGLSSGQAADGDLAWYAEDGITHFALSATTSFGVGGWSLAPQVGFVYGVDDFAKVDGDAFRVAVGVTLSQSFAVRR